MNKVFLFVCICFMSCDRNRSNVSFWQKQGNRFKYHNKKEFASDNTLRNELAGLEKVHQQLFTKITGGAVYLYSWQDRKSPSTNEFTVISQEGEQGLTIYYLVLNKNDSLLAWRIIGGNGIEGGYHFETRSWLIGPDTILSTSSITRMPDFGENGSKELALGDTTFTYFILGKAGGINDVLHKKAEILHYKKQ